MFNFVSYFEILCSKLIATNNIYHFCRVSGLGNMEDVLSNFSSKKAYLAVDDSDDGVTMQRGGAFFNRRSIVVYILKKYNINDMLQREAVMSEARTIYTDLLSKLILDQQTIDGLMYLDKSRIPYYEVPGYFAAGTTGLYFVFSLEEPFNLQYNVEKWNDNPR